ncbi:hypothetical protein JZ751_015580 [Albula glossodonta]|uniref:Uncharacterized protein n=1 Tax=Albula glossodonta TaxID=121402 RepID=A0A8T2NZ83_9TELE|nr:hypothetical protein JZ751_015580 [Albula glossodonta]
MGGGGGGETEDSVCFVLDVDAIIHPRRPGSQPAERREGHAGKTKGRALPSNMGQGTRRWRRGEGGRALYMETVKSYLKDSVHSDYKSPSAVTARRSRWPWRNLAVKIAGGRRSDWQD